MQSCKKIQLNIYLAFILPVKTVRAIKLNHNYKAIKLKNLKTVKLNHNTNASLKGNKKKMAFKSFKTQLDILLV